MDLISVFQRIGGTDKKPIYRIHASVTGPGILCDLAKTWSGPLLWENGGLSINCNDCLGRLATS